MEYFTGLQYLKMDVASNFGLDGENWSERLLWTETRIAFLEELTEEAKEPAMYYASVLALRKALAGEPSGYPVSFDATASGLQLLSCLVECEKSARLCNLIDTGKREDAYITLYQIMCNVIDEARKIARKDVKKAIMTAFYTSTAMPKRVFGEGKLLEVFYDTLKNEAPGAWELNLALKSLWQEYAPSHDWVLPDNFHVKIKVMDVETNYIQWMNQPIQINTRVNRGTKEGRSLPANIVHCLDGLVVREMNSRCSFSKENITEVILNLNSNQTRNDRDKDKLVMTLWKHYQDSGFLSARILKYLDTFNMGLVDQFKIAKLLKTLPDEPFEVLSNHDCFRVLPNYGNDVRKQYNQILSDIAASDMLSFIASQIIGFKLPVVKSGNISKQILEANYAIC